MINEIHPPTKIYIKFIKNKKGWGVFCKEKILKGESVEKCYGIVDNYTTSPLKDYAFSINKNGSGDDLIHLLGYGSIYNHNDDANIIWKVVETNIIEFIAIKDIEIDEEICHNYGKRYLKFYKSKFI
jgi:SET domain-containing protein